MRTILDLPEDQVNALAELCKSERISRAEAVRRALEEMLAQKKSQGREQAFRAWKNRANTRKIVENLRQE